MNLRKGVRELSIEEKPWGDKFKDFSNWFHELIKHCDIVDIRYPLKGMNVWRPYGLKALRLMQRLMIDLLEEHGHEEAYFPTLIPESVFSKESDFLKGFGGESFVVEGTLTKRFNEKLFIRPTSETVMYYMWSMWIKGRKDLPVKMYQIVNVFRYETKMTHPILRVREIMGFIEAHTAHATREEAEKQIWEAIGIYRRFFDKLLLPYFIVKTPPWDVFAGAEYNYDFITVTPDGKGLELGSVINLGQKFAHAFDIKYTDSDGSTRYVYQTCYGISERTLGAVIAIHGDDKGLFLPPVIAPIQVVIVPIAKPGENDVLVYADNVAQHLRRNGFRVHVDKDTEHTPGWKYYYWEMRGVPIRVEIGRREVDNHTVTIARRDGLPKKTLLLDAIVDELSSTLRSIEENMYVKSLEYFKRMISIAWSIDEALESDKRGLIVVPWDGTRECADYFEKNLGKQLLGEIAHTPIDLGDPRGRIVCENRVADRFAVLGVTY